MVTATTSGKVHRAGAYADTSVDIWVSTSSSAVARRLRGQLAADSTNYADPAQYDNGNIHVCLEGPTVMSSEKDNSLQVIKQIEQLPDNWNGYGAAAFSKDLLDTVRRLVLTLPVQPAIFPTARDSVQLEYENQDQDYLEFELFADGRVKQFSCSSTGQTETRQIAPEAVGEAVREFYGRDL